MCQWLRFTYVTKDPATRNCGASLDEGKTSIDLSSLWGAIHAVKPSPQTASLYIYAADVCSPWRHPPLAYNSFATNCMWNESVVCAVCPGLTPQTENQPNIWWTDWEPYVQKEGWGACDIMRGTQYVARIQGLSDWHDFYIVQAHLFSTIRFRPLIYSAVILWMLAFGRTNSAYPKCHSLQVVHI